MHLNAANVPVNDYVRGCAHDYVGVRGCDHVRSHSFPHAHDYVGVRGCARVRSHSFPHALDGVRGCARVRSHSFPHAFCFLFRSYVSSL